MASAVLATARQRCLVVLLTDLNPAALTEGLLPRIGLLAARHRLLIGAVADPRVASWRPARGDAAGGLRGRGGARGRRPSGPGSPPCCAGAASRSWTPRPDRLPPALADAYLR